MKKWKKILISLITVFVLAMLPAESAILPSTVCVTEAAPRIQFFQAYHDQGAEQNTEDHRSQKGRKSPGRAAIPKSSL